MYRTEMFALSFLSAFITSVLYKHTFINLCYESCCYIVHYPHLAAVNDMSLCKCIEPCQTTREWSSLTELDFRIMYSSRVRIIPRHFLTSSRFKTFLLQFPNTDQILAFWMCYLLRRRLLNPFVRNFALTCWILALWVGFVLHFSTKGIL